MKPIHPSSLIDLQATADEQGIPLRTHLAYASADNFLGEVIYRPDARLWLHIDLAQIVLAAAERAAEEHGLYFVVTDGLRTVDSQQLMLDSRVAKANPQWIEQEMLSKPGFGGHPRGMAVDIILETEDQQLLDMGTKLDDMSAASARNYHDLPKDVLERRRLLEVFMCEAAADKKLPMYPLPSEWWDFRFPPDYYNAYAPLSDADLPPVMRMGS